MLTGYLAVVGFDFSSLENSACPTPWCSGTACSQRIRHSSSPSGSALQCSCGYGTNVLLSLLLSIYDSNPFSSHPV